MEQVKFNHFGVMLDMSRNAVMKVSEIKHFMTIIKKMGYNSLELYMEDTFEVINEPYFGYMRGRYTKEELKELDAYAKSIGIELIPAIQTLAHFTNMVRHGCYGGIIDCGDILLAGEEKTYEFLDRIISTIAECFSSDLINIGMDEAHMVGLGAYLEKNGFQDRFDILIKHLNRVAEICAKYNLKPHMWSDMFFRLATGGYYIEKPIEIPQNIKDRVPVNVDLIYWDYYNTDEKIYDAMFKTHNAFNRKTWFAGGAWCWNGFAPHNQFSLITMKVAMKELQKNNIENVMITMWGDDGKDCSFYSVIPALFAIRRYADGEFDDEIIKTEFFKLFNISFDDFMLLDIPNYSIASQKDLANLSVPQNPSKSLLYSDVMLGNLDLAYQAQKPIPYNEYAKKLESAAQRVGEYNYIFMCLSKLCKALDIKVELGFNIRNAYKKGEKAYLKNYIPDILKCKDAVKEFHKSFYYLWHKENKSFGWEVHDIRIGGVIQRLDTLYNIIIDYTEGRLEQIDEFEVELLFEYPSRNLYCNRYKELASYSNLGD